MKKFSSVTVAVLMAILMAILVPMQAIAAKTETYVSEVVIETGATPEEAKTKLTEAGYNVYDENISNSANDKDTFGYMYIGYKTTTNPDEAITDMRLMHMGGGYSYAEYEEIIKQRTEDIDLIMTHLNTAVQEFRANYKQNKKAAVTAYKMLNQLKEDDTGMLLGDYFLDTAKTKADYINVFLQCSTAVLLTVENALAIACSATTEQGILAVSDLDKEDFIGETQYEDVASDIYNDLASVQKVLSTYAESGLTTADGATDEDVEAAFNALPEDDKLIWSDAFAFAYTLESIELSDGTTLYDLFMTDLNELTNEDLYPLASVLSAGQAAMLPVAGIKNIITAAVMTGDDWKKAESCSYETEEPISVYAGIDRSLFEGGVALTSKAMVEAAANTEKGWFGGVDAATEEIFYKIIGISFFTFLGACAIYGFYSTTRIAVFNAMWPALTKISVGTITSAGGFIANPAYELAYARVICALKVVKYTFAVVGYIAMAALGVLLIASAVYLIALGINYYYPKYDDIPRILVEKDINDKEETVYTYYYGVKTLAGNVMDINQHDGPRWMSLYTTKDPEAGTPILADFEIKGENILNGYCGVRKFSQEVAFDMNKFSYNLGFSVKRDGKSVDINSSYLFYKQAESTNNYASTFSDNSVLFGVSGLALGLIAGVVGTALFTKKKKVGAEA